MGGGGTKPNTTLSPPESSNILRLCPYSVQLRQFDFEDSNTFSACWRFHNPRNSGMDYRIFCMCMCNLFHMMHESVDTRYMWGLGL